MMIRDPQWVEIISEGACLFFDTTAFCTQYFFDFSAFVAHTNLEKTKIYSDIKN